MRPKIRPQHSLAVTTVERPCCYCRRGILAGPEVVTKVRPSIKTHKLQNPQNKREILADDKLRAVFGGKDKVSMFEMSKHFAQHLS